MRDNLQNERPRIHSHRLKSYQRPLNTPGGAEPSDSPIFYLHHQHSLTYVNQIICLRGTAHNTRDCLRHSVSLQKRGNISDSCSQDGCAPRLHSSYFVIERENVNSIMVLRLVSALPGGLLEERCIFIMF